MLFRSPNLRELEVAIGPWRSEAEMYDKCQQLLARHQVGALLVTRGEQGMTLMRRGEKEVHLPARSREVFDVTGAGDTVIAALLERVSDEFGKSNGRVPGGRFAVLALGKLGGGELTADIDLSTLLTKVVTEAAKMLQADRATLFLNDREYETLSEADYKRLQLDLNYKF